MNKTILLATLGAALIAGGCSTTGMRADSMGLASAQVSADARLNEGNTMAGSYAESASSMASAGGPASTSTMGATSAMTAADMRAASLAPGRN